VLTRYILPLGEVVIDFYDRLKSVTKGYASLEYVSDGYQDANVVKLSFQVSHSVCQCVYVRAHTHPCDRAGHTRTRTRIVIRKITHMYVCAAAQRGAGGCFDDDSAQE
jgi:translation elongation factor EF-4